MPTDPSPLGLPRPGPPRADSCSESPSREDRSVTTAPSAFHLDRATDGTVWLLLRTGTDLIGYLNVLDCGNELWVMEIAVHPGHRGHGHGTYLLRTLLDENPDAQIALSCGSFAPEHAWRRAPEGLPDAALAAWYVRHGFRPDIREGEDRRMVRLPCPVEPKSHPPSHDTKGRP
ncbi:GNAT family N-acetyltransferase (plasmid) [Streptomyces sp. NBC_01278]